MKYMENLLPENGKLYDYKTGKALDANGEIFLRLISDYLMGNNLVRRCRVPPTEIYNLDGYRDNVTDLALQAAYLTVNYLLSRPYIYRDFRDYSSGKEPITWIESGRYYKKSRAIGAGRISSGADIINDTLCPPAIEIIQTSIFDMLRLIFHNGAHNGVQVYLLGIKLWLTWIQPWNAGASERVRGDSKNNYDDSRWKAYVLANFHFYTTLPVMFFKSVKELDISQLDLQDLETFLELFSCVTSFFGNRQLSGDIRRWSSSYQIFVKHTKFEYMKRKKIIDKVKIYFCSNVTSRNSSMVLEDDNANEIFAIYHQHVSHFAIYDQHVSHFKYDTSYIQEEFYDGSAINFYEDLGDDQIWLGVDARFKQAIRSQRSYLSFEYLSELFGIKKLFGSLLMLETEISYKLLQRKDEFLRLIECDPNDHRLHDLQTNRYLYLHIINII